MNKIIKAILAFCFALYILFLHYIVNIVFGFAKQKNSRFNGIQRNFLFLNEWMDKKRKNPLKLVESLEEYRTGRIAIYGAGEIGLHL